MKRISAPYERARSRKIAAPASLFDGWHFAVHRCHWELFGLFHREFVKDRKPYMSWAQHVPPRLDFQEGTVFYAGAEFLQVAFNGGDGYVEVHTGCVGQDADNEVVYRDGQADLLTAFRVKRAGWLLRNVDLVDWLRTGQRPKSAVEVVQSRSSCTGLLALTLPAA